MTTLFKIQGLAEQGGNVVIVSGLSSTPIDFTESFPGCTVSIFITGTGTLASLFQDSAGITPKANPFTSDAHGFWTAYIASGTYDVTFSGTGITTPFTVSAIAAGVVLPADVAFTDVANAFSKPQSIIYSSGVPSGTVPISITCGDTSTSKVLNNATNANAIASYTLINDVSTTNAFLLNGSGVVGNLYSGGPPNASLSFWNSDSLNLAINQIGSNGALWFSTNSSLRAKLSSSALELTIPLKLDGATSGSFQTEAQAIAGSYRLQYPNADPNVGDKLTVSAFTPGSPALILCDWESAGTSQTYDLSVFCSGLPGASQSIFRFIACRTFTLSLSASQGNASVAATAQTDFLVKVNGVTKATIRWAIGATSATVVSPVSSTISSGDLITIVAPSVPDATLANVTITLDASVATSVGIYDLGAQSDGSPGVSQVLFRFVAVRALTLPGTGNTAIADIAATAQTDFLIKVNGTTKCTMRFAAAGTVASVVSPTSVSLAAGDIVTIVAPASPDATIANLAFGLKGTTP